MDRGRGGGGGGGGRDDFFGDPFGGMGGFGGLGGGFGGIGGGFGGLGGQRSLVSSFFGGRDPFDDPFFNRPSIFGSNMFGSSMFGPPSMFAPSPSMIGEAPPSASGFIENQASQPNNKSKGPVIEEIVSDEEEEEKGTEQKKENPRKHSRSKEPYVQEPDDEAEERKNKHLQYRNEYNRADRMQPRPQSFSFQSSSVTYGGTNGAYYTSSTTRRMGNDGVVLEESKEADTTTRKATHRLSRGIQDKGHSVTRNLNPDGKVDTMQTLHNLNEDELPVFEEAWKGSARKHLPGWNEGFDLLGNTGSSRSGQQGQVQNGGWALPSTEQPQIPDRPYRANSSNGRTQ